MCNAPQNPPTHTFLSNCHGGLLALTRLSCSDRNLLITCHLYRATFFSRDFCLCCAHQNWFWPEGSRFMCPSGDIFQMPVYERLVTRTHFTELMSGREHKCWPVDLTHTYILASACIFNINRIKMCVWKPGKMFHMVICYYILQIVLNWNGFLLCMYLNPNGRKLSCREHCGQRDSQYLISN